MSTIEPYMPYFRVWAKHDPDKVRLDPDGPAVRTPKLGPHWHDVVGYGPLLFALMECVERRGGEWGLEYEPPGTYTGWVVLSRHAERDTHSVASRDHMSGALLIAYVDALEPE